MSESNHFEIKKLSGCLATANEKIQALNDELNKIKQNMKKNVRIDTIKRKAADEQRQVNNGH